MLFAFNYEKNSSIFEESQQIPEKIIAFGTTFLSLDSMENN